MEKHFGSCDTTNYSKIVLYTAISFKKIGNIDSAIYYYEKCNAIYEKLNPRFDRYFLNSCYELASIYSYFGREAFKKAQLYLKNKYAKMEGSAFAWAAFVLMK